MWCSFESCGSLGRNLVLGGNQTRTQTKSCRGIELMGHVKWPSLLCLLTLVGACINLLFPFLKLLSLLGSLRPQSSERKTKWVVIRRQLRQVWVNFLNVNLQVINFVIGHCLIIRCWNSCCFRHYVFENETWGKMKWIHSLIMPSSYWGVNIVMCS